MLELLPLWAKKDMKKYYYLSDYFVIHEGDKNTLIFIGTKGEENYLDAIMDPGYIPF